MTGVCSILSSKRLSRMVAVALFLFLVFLPSVLLAQGYFGTVSGEITDPSGAVVPGAKVVIKDEAKGFTFTATTDSAGHYVLTSVPPGMYTLTVEVQGFQREVRTGVKVNVSENATANFHLSVATSTQSVEVKEQVQNLSTEDAVTGQVVDRKFINDLPLVDRYVLDFVMIAPGMNNMSDQNSVGDTGTNFVSNGSRGASADVLMDGASITNFEPNGGITQVTYTPSAEAVEEFKVQQTNFSAEYGFTGASVVNMITRSGGNSFHGGIYDFIRNSMTDANNWFANAADQPISPLHRNNFGGTLGGPILKDKLFFFFDYDGTRDTSMATAQAGVPTDAERQGNFGGLCAAAGGAFNGAGECMANGQVDPAGQLWDPYSGVFYSAPPQPPANYPGYSSDLGAGAYRSAFIPFNNLATYTSPGNPKLAGTPYQLSNGPGNLIDPVAQKMMSYFPEPNYSGNGIYDNWVGSGSNYGANNQFDIKIDYQISKKNLLSGKYSQQWWNNTPFDCFHNLTDPCGSGTNSGTAHLFALNDTYTFSPTLILTSTLGFTRGAMTIDAYNSSFNSNPLGTLGFPSYLGSNGFLGVPAMFIGDYYSAGYTSIGQDPYGNYRQGQDTGQLSFLVTNIRGQHELKFGFEGRIHQQNYIQTNAPVGTFNFNNQGSSQCPLGDITQCGGDSLASFMMGQMGGSQGYEIQFRPATENYQFAGFGQDNWKVTAKLTLNIGMRYDVNVPRTERYNRMNWFDPNVVNPLNGGKITYTDPLSGYTVTRTLYGGEVFASPSARSNFVTNLTNFAPRFGFSYLLTPKTVMRGGYGMYYDQARSGASGVLPYGSQGFNQWTGAVGTYQNDGATPYLHLSNPFPNGLIQPPGNSLGLLNDVSYGAVGPIKTPYWAQTPYEQSWSLGFQRQLPYNVVVTADYVGKKGTKLPYNGGNILDVLGPWVEKLPTAQIGNLYNYVNNPFASILTTGPLASYYANSPLTAPQVQAFQLELPYPEYTSVTSDVPPIANSIYNALQITVAKNYSNGLALSANYTWSKSIDDSSMYDTNVSWLAGTTGGLWEPQDPNKPWLDRSLSTFDVPQIVKLNYSYDLPIGHGRPYLNNMPRILEAIVGGWKTAGVWTWQKGFPLNFETYGTPIPTYGPQRPNIVCTPKRTGGGDGNWVYNYFENPNCYQTPEAYTLGDASRTLPSIRSPFFFTANLSVLKDFAPVPSHENIVLELRLEAQNAFNHPVFGTPDTTVGDPNFGVISYTAVGPRQCQLALKLNF
ncbi:MAG TPA: TonB-dependent receptor [Verrucomicrobiae bacterium]|nr:TonB-dependent receptor [Verrucomicrobiae bacterium]